MQTYYVKKESLYPSFGQCLVYTDGRVVINIREDLPACVKSFLVVHEGYHSGDTETSWLKREVKANISGLRAHPWGFLVTCIMSLAPYRILYYIRLAKDNAERGVL